MGSRLKGCHKNDGKEADTHYSVQIKASEGPHSPHVSQLLTVAISLVAVAWADFNRKATFHHKMPLILRGTCNFSFYFLSTIPALPRSPSQDTSLPATLKKYILFYLVLRKLRNPHTCRCQSGMGICRSFLQACKGHSFQKASELATHWPSISAIISLNTEG